MVYYLFSVIFIILSLYCFHIYVHNSEKGKLINRLPGPTILPIIGNLLYFRTTPVGINKLLRKWNKMFYPVYKFWLGTKPIVVISHPDDLEILLTSSKHINKEFAYENLYAWMKTGLLTSNAEKWHQRRKILTKAFHFNILSKYMELTHHQAEKIIKNTSLEGKETMKNLLPFCSKYTLNIICESAMGVALDSTKKDTQKYKEAVYKMGKIIVYRTVRPYIKDWMLPFMPKLNKENKQILHDLNSFTNAIVNERREYHKNTNYALLDDMNEYEISEKELDNIIFGEKKKLSMLDLLLKSEKDGLIDDEGIKEEVATFIFEGHDTTAISMCFSILLLAWNKEAQNTARMEVEKILREKHGKLQTSDLQDMPYLERCIKESLRLYPSVPSITRYVLEDLQLKNCKVPKNTNIFLNLIDTHRDPEFWPEPDKFDPDRFLIDQVKTRHPFAYLPFSAGPRNCIGQKFAIMELKSLLANILYNFYLEPVDSIDDIQISTDVTLRPDKSVHAKFIRIDRK